MTADAGTPQEAARWICQFGGRAPQQRIKVLDIKMQLGNLISSARRNDDQPKPKREPRLKIDAAPVTGVVSHDKARPSDLGHYLVADAANVILTINTKRLKSSGPYSGIKTIRPSLVQTWIEPHSDETLCRTRFASSPRFDSQQSFHRKSTARATRPQIIVIDQDSN